MLKSKITVLALLAGTAIGGSALAADLPPCLNPAFGPGEIQGCGNTPPPDDYVIPEPFIELPPVVIDRIELGIIPEVHCGNRGTINTEWRDSSC